MNPTSHGSVPENITNRGNWNDEAEITLLTSHWFIQTESHNCNHRLIIVLFKTNKPIFMYKISGAALMLSRVLIPNSQEKCWCSALLVRGRWCSFSQQSSPVNKRRGWAVQAPSTLHAFRSENRKRRSWNDDGDDWVLSIESIHQTVFLWKPLSSIHGPVRKLSGNRSANKRRKWERDGEE